MTTDSRLQPARPARERRWVWAGALCALVGCWLASATVIYACWLAARGLARRFPSPVLWQSGWWQGANATDWTLRLLVPSWMVCGLLIGYFMGLICAFFWHRVGNKEPKVLLGTQWACWTLLIAHLPLLFNGFSFFLTLLSFPWMILPMWKGLESGLDWWPKREWRHLAGLSNQWEREADEL